MKKSKWIQPQGFLMLGALLLMLGALIFLTTSPTSAELATTSVVYAWDEDQNKYQNSLLEVYFDGGWVPFLHEIGEDQFNTTLFVSPTLNANTRWAGTMDYAVYYTDNSPAGAQGFRTTRRWSLVWCDRAQKKATDPLPPDGDFTGDDLNAPNPFQYYNSFLIENLTVIFQNRVDATQCGGNCQDELVTRLFVSLDKDNDGTIDASYRVGNTLAGAVRKICFYAEAQKPIVTTGDIWGGNLQARISDNGGDKTVNFHANYATPSAVTVSDFRANSARTNYVIAFATLGVLALGVLAWRAWW